MRIRIMFVCFFLNANVIFLFISSARGDTVSTSTSILLAKFSHSVYLSQAFGVPVAVVDDEYSSIFLRWHNDSCLWLCWCVASSQLLFFPFRSSFCWILPLALERTESCYRIHYVSECIHFSLKRRFSECFASSNFFFSFFVEHLWINGTFILAPRQIIWILDSDVVLYTREKNKKNHTTKRKPNPFYGLDACITT